MISRDDDPLSTAAAGEEGLRRRDVVAGAGALALSAAVGSTLPLVSRTARAQTPGQVGRHDQRRHQPLLPRGRVG
jgi:hypothetical protein